MSDIKWKSVGREIDKLAMLLKDVKGMTYLYSNNRKLKVLAQINLVKSIICDIESQIERIEDE